MSNPEASSRRKVSDQKLTRRQMLKLTGATIIGGGSAAIFDKNLAAEREGKEMPFVIGTLERFELPDLLYLTVATDSDQITAQTIIVKVLESTTISRGVQGIVGDIEAFVSGDQIVAEGEWHDGVFVAVTLMSLYHSIEGEIINRKQERLETTSGIILLTPDTKAAATEGYKAESLDDLSNGTEIAALVWNDPVNRVYVLK